MNEFMHHLYLLVSFKLSNFCYWDIHFYLPLSSNIGEGDGTPLQDSFLENPMDGGA